MAAQDKILCYACGKPIKDNYDLIVAWRFFLTIRPYHSACYSQKLKNRGTLTYVINRYETNWRAVFGVLGLLLTAGGTPTRT
jgi:hypothetical protein